MDKIFTGFLLVLFLSLESHAATVSLSPAPSIIEQGDSFVLELVGSDFNNGSLDGGGVNISFDSSVINVTSVTVNSADWEFFSTNGSIDNLFGSVNGISFNSFQSRTGDLQFASIEFVAVGLGSSELGLSEYDLNPFATGGSLYPNLILDQASSVTVQAVPLPAALWLFITGIGLFATQKRN